MLLIYIQSFFFFLESKNEKKEIHRKKALEKQRKVHHFSEIIDSIIKRYNIIIEMIDAPSDYKFVDGIKIFMYFYYYYFLYVFDF